MHPNPRRIIPVILLIALAAAGWWYFSSSQAQAETPSLSASGTIEATQVVVAPELGGQVAEVLVAEGDSVQAGQLLVRFDDAMLQAQLAQAQAAFAVAKANYDLVAAGPTSEQRQVAVTAAQLELTNARQALKDLNDEANLAAAQAQQAVAAIDRARDQATQKLDNMNSNADQADIDAAQAAVVLAGDKLDRAKDKFEPYEKKSEDNVPRAFLQSQVADAQKHYDAVVTRLNNLLGTSNQYDLALAETDKALTEAQLADAQRKYDDLKNGPDPDALALAQARLANAEANLAAAQAEPSQQQLALAQAQVDFSQAALQVIQTQIDKLVLYAPLDSVVLTRSVEPGETALPGAPLLTLARLDNLTITIYLPEDRYGEVKLGQSAQVQVDSFPGTTFTATVVHIADQAEFTPRNVQTAEGRRTTVFAVKLAIDPAGGKLKPGMPADVSFEN